MSRQPKVTAEDPKLQVRVVELAPTLGESRIMIYVRNGGRYRATYALSFTDGSGLGYAIDPGVELAFGPFGRWMIPDQVIKEAAEYHLLDARQEIPEGGPEDFRGRI